MVSPEEEIKSLAKSYCEQFDHVFMLLQPGRRSNDFQSFLSKERIINLSMAVAPKIPNHKLEDTVRSIVNGNMFVAVVKKNRVLDRNVRWLIYDRIKEMKAPLTDVIKLDSSGDYCLENEWLTLTFRHGFQ